MPRILPTTTFPATIAFKTQCKDTFTDLFFLGPIMSGKPRWIGLYIPPPKRDGLFFLFVPSAFSGRVSSTTAEAKSDINLVQSLPSPFSLGSIWWIARFPSFFGRFPRGGIIFGDKINKTHPAAAKRKPSLAYSREGGSQIATQPNL